VVIRVNFINGHSINTTNGLYTLQKQGTKMITQTMTLAVLTLTTPAYACPHWGGDISQVFTTIQASAKNPDVIESDQDGKVYVAVPKQMTIDNINEANKGKVMKYAPLLSGLTIYQEESEARKQTKHYVLEFDLSRHVPHGKITALIDAKTGERHEATTGYRCWNSSPYPLIFDRTETICDSFLGTAIEEEFVSNTELLQSDPDGKVYQRFSGNQSEEWVRGFINGSSQLEQMIPRIRESDPDFKEPLYATFSEARTGAEGPNNVFIVEFTDIDCPQPARIWYSDSNGVPTLL
jgi:hypothetical protein